MEELQKRFEKEQLVDWLESEVRKGVVGKEVMCYSSDLATTGRVVLGRHWSVCAPPVHYHF